MPAIKAKSIEDAKRRLRVRFGKTVALSTTRLMKRVSKFQREQYGRRLNWYRAEFTKKSGR